LRIGLNLLHAQPDIGGAWQYIERFVAALAEHDHEHTYVPFVTEASRGLVPPRFRAETVSFGFRASSRATRILWQHTGLPMAARRKRLDLLHWFSNTMALVNSVPGVVTVYDLQVFENPGRFPTLQRTYLQTMLPRTVRTARMLLPISRSTAAALQTALKVDPRRMQVVPAIVGDVFQPQSADRIAAFRRAHALPPKFWLYVAHFYSHKNHARLVEAHHRLRGAGFPVWPLVLRGDDHGAGDDLQRLIMTLGAEADVRFLPRLDEADLPALYGAASALVFPSLHEGCGIPLLEANACGCATVVSDIPAAREFGGEDVSRFDPNSVESIAAAMRAFQCQPPGCPPGAGAARANRAEHVVADVTSAYARAAGMEAG
jgi:alpha-1,3-rhamnosyl/mannosyltransferase